MKLSSISNYADVLLYYFTSVYEIFFVSSDKFKFFILIIITYY